MHHTTPTQAKHYLGEKPADSAFVTITGTIIRSLEALRDNLKDMTEEAFSYHVNKDKNDFSNWVADIVGDNELAIMLAGAKSRDIAAAVVESRVCDLKELSKPSVARKSDPTSSFVTCDGKSLHTIYDLADYLDEVSEDSYAHHVHDHKNDFAAWVRHVFHDSKLAAILEKQKTREKTQLALLKYIVGHMREEK